MPRKNFLSPSGGGGAPAPLHPTWLRLCKVNVTGAKKCVCVCCSWVVLPSIERQSCFYRVMSYLFVNRAVRFVKQRHYSITTGNDTLKYCMTAVHRVTLTYTLQRSPWLPMLLLRLLYMLKRWHSSRKKYTQLGSVDWAGVASWSSSQHCRSVREWKFRK